MEQFTGTQLAAWRKRLRITKVEAATLLGTNATQVARWEARSTQPVPAYAALLAWLCTDDIMLAAIQWHVGYQRRKRGPKPGTG